MPHDATDVAAVCPRGRDLHKACATVDRTRTPTVVVRIRVAGDPARAGEALSATDSTGRGTILDDGNLGRTIRIKLLNVSANATDLIRIAGSSNIDVSMNILDAAHHISIAYHAAATLIAASLRGDFTRESKTLYYSKIVSPVIARTAIATPFDKTEKPDIVAVAVRGGDGHTIDGIPLTVEPAHELLVIVAVDADTDVPVVLAEVNIIDEFPKFVLVIAVIVTKLLCHQRELRTVRDLVRRGCGARATVKVAGAIVDPVATNCLRGFFFLIGRESSLRLKRK